MKITSVEIHPDGSSDFAELSFRDPSRSNPYNVKAIVGLDANEIVPKFYESAGSNQFYDLSLQKREIVMRIELNARFGQNETYSDLRDELYKMISTSRTGKVQLLFKNGPDVMAAISGFVSKFEAAHFERIQEVQLTVKCDEPMLTAPDRVTVGIAGLNPVLTVIDDHMSNAPHGFIFDMNINATFISLIFSDPDDSSWNFTITPVGGFQNGDILHFSSEYNNKYLYSTRGATTIYLTDVLNMGVVWPILFPGANKLACNHGVSVSWRAISYYPTYWGV